MTFHHHKHKGVDNKHSVNKKKDLDLEDTRNQGDLYHVILYKKKIKIEETCNSS